MFRREVAAATWSNLGSATSTKRKRMLGNPGLKPVVFAGHAPLIARWHFALLVRHRRLSHPPSRPLNGIADQKLE
jgi:hypothetical protein